MAKDDDDLIGFLMKTLFQFFGWIFLGIFKLLWFVISGIFKGIASAFRKNDEPETTAEGPKDENA